MVFDMENCPMTYAKYITFFAAMLSNINTYLLITNDGNVNGNSCWLINTHFGDEVFNYRNKTG